VNAALTPECLIENMPSNPLVLADRLQKTIENRGNNCHAPACGNFILRRGPEHEKQGSRRVTQAGMQAAQMREAAHARGLRSLSCFALRRDERRMHLCSL
jgi:hypothetical protein